MLLELNNFDDDVPEYAFTKGVPVLQQSQTRQTMP